MFGRKNKQKPDFIESVSSRSTILSIADSPAGLDALVSFISVIRPHHGHRDATANLAVVTTVLQQRPIVLRNLQHAILSQLVRTDLSSALMESGIPLARGFWQELFGRLRHKLLPPLQPENDFLYVLNRVFFRNHDYIWVEDIPRADWIAFFESLGLSLHIDDPRILRQLLLSLSTLSFQVAQLGLEKEVLHYIPEQFRDGNPFVEQHYLIHALQEKLAASDEDPAASDDREVGAIGSQLKQVVGRCYECIDYVRANHSINGASLHQTYMLLLLGNRLERITILVDLLDEDKAFDMGKFVDLFRML